jgi:hypothetical protein
MTTTEKRDRNLYSWTTDPIEVADGLRALADLIENGQVEVPSGLKPAFWIHPAEGQTEKEATRQLLRTLGGGHWDKRTWEDSLILEGWIGGLPVDVWVNRRAVCERVVVGVDTVIETVPVGEDTRPVETLTREVERVEWVCSPLLDDAPQAVGA